MEKYNIEYETHNPITGDRSDRKSKTIEAESRFNAIAALGQKINKDYCIDVYSCDQVK
jgi:hypothetical protein